MSKFWITYEEAQELILKCVSLQNELMESGFVTTYHAMHKVTQEIGHEFSKIIEGKHVTKLVCPHGFQDFDECVDCRH